MQQDIGLPGEALRYMADMEVLAIPEREYGAFVGSFTVVHNNFEFQHKPSESRSAHGITGKIAPGNSKMSAIEDPKLSLELIMTYHS